MGEEFFRSAFYIPVLISGIVSGFIWKIMYNYNFGTLNAMLQGVGLGDFKQDWLGNAALTLPMIGVVLIWKGAGYYMIIYLASCRVFRWNSLRQQKSTVQAHGSVSKRLRCR